jgi:PIN domain nuclease of toxin-antitoxin system
MGRPPSGKGAVLDASAVVALANSERGRTTVMRELWRRPAAISTVTLAELYALEKQNRIASDWRSRLSAEGVEVRVFEEKDARATGDIWPECKGLAGGLGDRATLALARKLRWAAVTTDAPWGAVANRLGGELVVAPR